MDLSILIRAGYGKGEIDQQFRKYAQWCDNNNISFGVYWESYAYNLQLAKEEAIACAETIEEFLKCRCVYWGYGQDAIRYAKSLGIIVTDRMIQEMAEAFCGYINARGYDSGIFIKS